jgi:hypothetical protein
VGRRLVGLDLGSAADPTALVVLESTSSPAGPKRDDYAIRHLERFPLNQPYPTYVDRVVELMRTPELRRATLVIDYTGVGRPVFDMFDLVPGLSPLGILITGGTTVTHKGRIWRVPKRDLATAVLALLQSKRLRVSSRIPEASVLVTELLNFRVKITLAGNDQYEAWREGDHDDYVLAAACACWTALHVPASALSPEVGGQHRILSGVNSTSVGSPLDKRIVPLYPR